MEVYKIADVVFGLETKYKYTPKICEAYLCKGEKPEFTIKITDADIESEKKLAPEFKESYLESLAVYRKLCVKILKEKDGFIFHSSAIMVDGEAYIFTAPSGTGKSTHTRLWREMLGDKAVMINDDKPIFRLIDGVFYVYGTPWDGKHHLSTNTRAKIKAIAEISQSKDNHIERATTAEILPTLLNQTLRFSEAENMIKLLDLIEKLISSVKLYKTGINMSPEAAEMTYNTMRGETL